MKKMRLNALGTIIQAQDLPRLSERSDPNSPRSRTPRFSCDNAEHLKAPQVDHEADIEK